MGDHSDAPERCSASSASSAAPRAAHHLAHRVHLTCRSSCMRDDADALDAAFLEAIDHVEHLLHAPRRRHAETPRVDPCRSSPDGCARRARRWRSPSSSHIDAVILPVAERHRDIEALLGILCVCRATGRLTSTPRCNIGAATMKMMSSTSITSTSGTTLISARLVDDASSAARRVRPPPGSASPSASLGEVPLGDVQELEREVVHLRRVRLHLRGEVVIEVDGRNRREQARRPWRSAPRRCPARRRRDRSSPGSRCSKNAVHDAPHRAEQADEWRDARRGGQKRHALLQFVDFDRRGAQQGAIHRREALQGWTRRLRRPGLPPRRGLASRAAAVASSA